jgi:hypothetical protein
MAAISSTDTQIRIAKTVLAIVAKLHINRCEWQRCPTSMTVAYALDSNVLDLRRIVEEFDFAGFNGVFGANNTQVALLD